jgi:hypothetical protein
MAKRQGDGSSARAATSKMGLADALHRMGLYEATLTIRGVIFGEPDGDRVSLADSGSSYVVIPLRDIVAVTELGGGISEVRVLADSAFWRTSKVSAVSMTKSPALRVFSARVDEENLRPAISLRAAGDPTAGTSADQAKLKTGKTIEGAAKVFMEECAGGGEYTNNCAHFLSNAFIKSGLTDFDAPHACIKARCSVKEGQLKECKFSSQFQYRPIRAKELRCWFQEKATTTVTEAANGSGFWAAYQEKPSDSQGHVAILDTNNWHFYGTGWYSKAQGWTQEYYKW